MSLLGKYTDIQWDILGSALLGSGVESLFSIWPQEEDLA
jgi:hypothetical protein